MGPYTNESAADARGLAELEDSQLQAARETFPDLRIIETFGGYLAVPKDVIIVSATTVDGLVGMLREALG